MREVSFTAMPTNEKLWKYSIDELLIMLRWVLKQAISPYSAMHVIQDVYEIVIVILCKRAGKIKATNDTAAEYYVDWDYLKWVRNSLAHDLAFTSKCVDKIDEFGVDMKYLSDNAGVARQFLVPSDTAILTLEPGYTVFLYNGRIVKFGCSKTLEKILSIKEWRDGCATVDAKYSYSDTPIEEYVDVGYALDSLYIDPDEFLAPVKKVEVGYV